MWKRKKFPNTFWHEQEKNKHKICQSEVKTLKYSAINCIVEIKNSTRIVYWERREKETAR